MIEKKMKIIKCSTCNKTWPTKSQIPENLRNLRCPECKKRTLFLVSEEILENKKRDEKVSIINGVGIIEKAKERTQGFSAKALNASKKALENVGHLKEKAKNKENYENQKSDYKTFRRDMAFGKRRIKYSIIILIFLLTFQSQLLRGILYENVIFGAIDNKAKVCIDESFKRAMIAFGIAKAINSGISVLQESELSIQPAGIGVSIAIGEILDPVNDLVERFSWVMMVSVMSLGIQEILLQIGPWLSLKFLFSFGSLFLLLALWTKNNWQSTCILIAKKTLLFALIARFSIPLVVYLNNLTYDAFLNNQYQSASGDLKQGQEAFENTDFEAIVESSFSKDEEAGYWEKAKSIVKKAGSFISFRDRINWIKAKASDMSDSLIRLSVVFIINTILLPIGFLWGLLKFSRLVLGNSFGIKLEETFRSKIISPKMSSDLAAQTN